MSYTYNGRTLLEAAASPIAAADLARLVDLIGQHGDHAHAFIARWSPETGVCFTGTVVEGELIGWMMFPAATEAAARDLAEALYEQARRVVLGHLDPAANAAAAAIAKAAGR